MDKDLFKKKFGLPPVPPIGTGSQKRSSMQRKRDYTPIPWDKYFHSKKDLQLSSGTFRLYETGTEGPVLLFLHGGGFSGLSWALLSVQVTSLVKCRCVALDMRGHGDTVTDDDSNLSTDRMTQDIGEVVSNLYDDDPPPIILVGHSMGGALAVHTAAQKLIPSLIGLAVIDVVEGTAMDALTSMQSFLRGRPKTFDSMDKAIEWSVRSGQIQNVESARVSMAGQLKRLDNDDLNAVIESQCGIGSILEEEDEPLAEEEKPTTSSLSVRSPTCTGSLLTNAPSCSLSTTASSLQVSELQKYKYTWRINLSQTEVYWPGWFEGLSKKFLSCEPPKVLILAGHDRLDKDLTIGQMQGKFQMNLLPQCGHAVHEDVPDKVAEILSNFMLRHRVTEAV